MDPILLIPGGRIQSFSILRFKVSKVRCCFDFPNKIIQINASFRLFSHNLGVPERIC